MSQHVKKLRGTKARAVAGRAACERLKKRELAAIKAAAKALRLEAKSLKESNVNFRDQWDGDYHEAKQIHDGWIVLANRLERIIAARGKK